MSRDALVARLARGGFVAPDEEADELLAAAGGDAGRLGALVARRETGEPLAWITGTTRFCGLDVLVHEGVYVPRWQSEPLAERAAQRLPPDGVAVDLCTGTGAMALVLQQRRPRARVVATDLDPRAVANARANGVDAHEGDLFAPLDVRAVDVVTGVVPYVPTPELGLLQRDTLAHEDVRSYDGGPDGLAVLRRAVDGAAEVLRDGGALLLELGGDQAADAAPYLHARGFTDVAVLRDEDGDPRGVEATKAPSPSSAGR